MVGEGVGVWKIDLKGATGRGTSRFDADVGVNGCLGAAKSPGVQGRDGRL